MKKILFIHNHKDFSGAARSLAETIEGLKFKYEIYVICPTGSASSFLSKCKINVINVKGVPRFNHFEIGYYKSLRWLILLRETIFLIYFFFKLFNLKKKLKKIENIHLNEFELIILSPILNFFFKTNITTHLRSRLRLNSGNLRIKFLKFISRKFIKKIIAIDNDCYETSYDKKNTEIVYNVLNKEKEIKKNYNNNINLTFGFIGNFLKRKGIYDLLLAFKKINQMELPINLLVGGTEIKRSFLNNFFYSKKNFKNFLIKNRINNCSNIKFLGPVSDLNNFYSKIDVLIFPSYFNCVGRPVIESSLFKIPSIVGMKKYNEDTVIKNASLIFTPGNIQELVEKILIFYKNKKKVIEMGENAYKNATRLFDQKANTEKFIRILNLN